MTEPKKEHWNVPHGQTFVDDEWMHGDPVWPIVRVEGEKWVVPGGPYTVTAAWQDRIVVECSCGCSQLLGSRFIERKDLFRTWEGANEEADVRNGHAPGRPDG